MEATVGDTEFWMLAKRVIAGGGSLDSNDTVFTLNAKLTNLMGSGGSGGGGGIPEAPTDGQLYGRESAAWAVVPPVSPGNLVSKAGDTMTGALAIAWATDSNLGLTVSNPFGDSVVIGPYSIRINNSSNYVPTIQIADHSGNSLSLSINPPTGDLLVTATTGPNAGKSVNLTAGKWA